MAAARPKLFRQQIPRVALGSRWCVPHPSRFPDRDFVHWRFSRAGSAQRDVIRRRHRKIYTHARAALLHKPGAQSGKFVIADRAC
jgi:hypothetical protein